MFQRHCFSFRPLRMRSGAIFSLLAASALVLAGCAQQPKQTGKRSKEYFPSSKYGAISPRVVGEGKAVPKGGGRYLVGRPYTIAGRTYVPSKKPEGYRQTGMASWYGEAFHGRRTSNGEIYDRRSITAAHPTMPLPSYARVTNTANGRSIIVRVNDRGPFHAGRVMDLSQRAAELLEYRSRGTTRVTLEYLGPADLAGSDDNKLLASLTTDGPARFDGPTGRTMVASNEPATPPAPIPAAPPATTVRAVSAQAFAPLAPPAAIPGPLAAAGSVTLPSAPPLPPMRPFDLGTIPGAGVPIAAPRPPSARLDSFRAARAINFAPDSSLAARLEQDGPFARLAPPRFAPPGAAR